MLNVLDDLERGKVINRTDVKASDSSLIQQMDRSNETPSTIPPISSSTQIQEEFFNSYISNPDSREANNLPSSSCSDSVSRCGDNPGRNSKNASFTENRPQNLSGSGQPIPPPAWYSHIQSDSSSLVTLVTDKKMSDSRRTFCLFVTFDLILTVLLWLIGCGTSASSNHSFFNIVGIQITEYNVSNSLFDVVCLAVLRFAFLETMYAGLRIRHWWPVALSTSVTDILLILKIFPIFENASSPDFFIDIPMTVVLLLTNFVLSWIEVWFIDFKVVPSEAKLANRTVKEFLQNSQHQNSFSFHHQEASANEKTPLLRGFSAHTPPQSFYTGATSDHASYHSLPESDFNSCISDVRFSQRGSRMPHRAVGHLTKEDACQVEKGRTALNQLWNLFKNDGIWKLDRELESGDKLYSTNVPGYGKTFRIDTVVHGCTAQQVYQQVVVKAEKMPEWNMAVQDVKILKRIGEQTAISLEVSKPAANGLIKSRDFVTVRRVDKFDNMYISAGVNTEYDIEETGRIRGENGPTGFIIEQCNENGFSACKFTWILNTNLKGSIPQYLVNSNLQSTMINFVSSMKQYLGLED